MSNLLYIDKVAENRALFSDEVIKVATRLNIKPDWLMLVFYIETGAARTGVIDHRARNAQTNATGLIQFMPSTAKSLGTTVDELRNMNNIEQLKYVEKFLQPFASKIKNYTDCYLAVFFPVAIGKADSWVLQAKGLPAEKVAAQNPLYVDKALGVITVSSIKKKLERFILKGYTL